jgi:MtN3 and saliva related transmembrane protein
LAADYLERFFSLRSLFTSCAGLECNLEATSAGLHLKAPAKIISITNVIGWVSTMVLLATIGRQVYSQWKSKATSGVSRWLFVGQISASIGFICYSYQLHNWVFLFSNSAMLITAIIGEIIYVSNRK